MYAFRFIRKAKLFSEVVEIIYTPNSSEKEFTLLNSLPVTLSDFEINLSYDLK